MNTFSNSESGIKAIIEAANEYEARAGSPMKIMFGGNNFVRRDAAAEAKKIMSERILAILACSSLVPQSSSGYLSDLQSPTLKWEVARDRLIQLKPVLPYQEWGRLTRSFGYYPEMEAAAEEGEKV